MSILLPDASRFVVVGTNLKEELEKQEAFNKYFENRLNQLMFVDDPERFNIEDYGDKSRTLFIVKHFDIEPDKKHGELKPNGDNNNHLINPQLARIADDQDDSVGYTTDYDDDTSMQVTEDDHHQNEGRWFSLLRSNKCSIMGSMALIQNIRRLESHDKPILMVPQERPLHNLAMHDMLITFSAITNKQEAKELLTLTRYMGARSREDVTTKTTHVVAANVRGLKYKKALELGKIVMNIKWVRESYRLAQDDADFYAGSPQHLKLHKLKPFHGLSLAFSGFDDEAMNNMSKYTRDNEGKVVVPESLSCTHIVVNAIAGDNDSETNMFIHPSIKNVHVVYRDWFYASIEMDGKAHEEEHVVPRFKPLTRRSSKVGRRSTGYHSFSQLLSPMLDYSRSPECMNSVIEPKHSTPQSTEPPKEISARRHICFELLQTQRNFVKILETMINLFKIPLEESIANDPNDPILPANDVKTIFGNLTPIYEVHRRLLSNLESLIEDNWDENNCIGAVLVSHSIDLLEAHKPYVNFYEDTKNTIIQCEAKYPRFHAFLMSSHRTNACNRESLTSALIRPVQRLPQIKLLVERLVKRTEDTNPDKVLLIEAGKSIDRVISMVDEDKKKTDGQIAMFEIVNSIEDCPPNLLSSNREFVCKAEAHLLFMNSGSEVVPSKSHKVVLFLFSDLIEICKIRSLKRSHSSKGTRTYIPIRRGITSTQASNKKDYRHLDELLLLDVKKVYKDCHFPEMSDAFVIEARPTAKYIQNFRYYSFILDDQHTSRATFIEKLDECLSSNKYDYVPTQDPVTIESIDFDYTNQLVSRMEKSRLSRVLSIRQSLLSPSLKSQRNLHHYLDSN